MKMSPVTDGNLERRKSISELREIHMLTDSNRVSMQVFELYIEAQSRQKIRSILHGRTLQNVPSLIERYQLLAESWMAEKRGYCIIWNLTTLTPSRPTASMATPHRTASAGMEILSRERPSMKPSRVQRQDQTGRHFEF